jgi:hypothetical protein
LEVTTLETATTDFTGFTVTDTLEATTTELTAEAAGTTVAAAAEAWDWTVGAFRVCAFALMCWVQEEASGVPRDIY